MRWNIFLLSQITEFHLLGDGIISEAYLSKLNRLLRYTACEIGVKMGN